MDFLFDDFYFCEYCNQYSMIVFSIESLFYDEFAIFKCSLCGEIEEHSILINF